MSTSLADRFWNKVDQRGDKDCWPWTSAKGYNGYGVFWVGGGVSRYAHRLMFEFTKGQIPDGMVVMHQCDNPGCVNPTHLSIGLPIENRRDSVKKKRHAYGERNGGGRKLSEAKVAEIKTLFKSGLGCSRLSKRYGVSAQTIKAIKRQRIWKHV